MIIFISSLIFTCLRQRARSVMPLRRFAIFQAVAVASADRCRFAPAVGVGTGRGVRVCPCLHYRLSRHILTIRQAHSKVVMRPSSPSPLHVAVGGDTPFITYDCIHYVAYFAVTRTHSSNHQNSVSIHTRMVRCGARRVMLLWPSSFVV